MKNTILLILLSFILLPSGMKGQEQTMSGNPTLEFLPFFLDFGEVAIGTEKILEFEVISTGLSEAVINRFIIDSNKAEFTVLDTVTTNNSIILKPDEKMTLRVKFKPKVKVSYKSDLILSDGFSTYFYTFLKGTGIEETNTSVQDITDIESLIFQSIDEGNDITFSIVSERALENGTFSIYSQEGKLIKSIVVSSNSTELSVSISKSEVPKLSLIRFTQGENTYVHKHLRE